VLFAPFVIAGLDSERSRTMTRNPLINSIVFLGDSGFCRNDGAFETASSLGRKNVTYQPHSEWNGVK